jgi:hypothetical protein
LASDLSAFIYGGSPICFLAARWPNGRGSQAPAG